MANSIEKKIYELIDKYHNPALVIPDASPNADKIFHLYNNGEITFQKGGYAYGERNEFTYESSIYNIKLLDITKFPQITNNQKSFYIIATEKHCCEIRNEMLKLQNL